jgi:RNA polymerase sigma-70 factor (ECF subfamily)
MIGWILMDYHNTTDEKLVEACKKRDDAAFQELMRRHIRPIFNFVRQYVKTDEDVEDVVQDAFFKAWKHIRRFKAGKMFRPWLYTIARNTALDHLKKRRAAAFSELDNDDTDQSFADTLEDAGPLPPELFERAESVAMLEPYLDALHPDYRAVLIMRYHEELSFNEIAEIMGKPMNTVKSWHWRALGDIRRKMPHRKP